MVKWFNFIFKMEWFLFCWGWGCSILNYNQKFLLAAVASHFSSRHASQWLPLQGLGCRRGEKSNRRKACLGKLIWDTNTTTQHAPVHIVEVVRTYWCWPTQHAPVHAVAVIWTYWRRPSELLPAAVTAPIGRGALACGCSCACFQNVPEKRRWRVHMCEFSYCMYLFYVLKWNRFLYLTRSYQPLVSGVDKYLKSLGRNCASVVS